MKIFLSTKIFGVLCSTVQMDTVTWGEECRKCHPSWKGNFQTKLVSLKWNQTDILSVLGLCGGFLLSILPFFNPVCSIGMESVRGCLPTTVTSVHNLAKCVISCIKIFITKHHYGGLNQNNFGCYFWGIKRGEYFPGSSEKCKFWKCHF